MTGLFRKAGWGTLGAMLMVALAGRADAQTSASPTLEAVKARGVLELDGATVCVLTGTSTEPVLADSFRSNKMKFTPVLIESDTAIEQVGNYGEIYERELAPLGIERGQNALWTKGALEFSPPFR